MESFSQTSIFFGLSLCLLSFICFSVHKMKQSLLEVKKACRGCLEKLSYIERRQDTAESAPADVLRCSYKHL